MSESVKVMVRARPMNQHEKNKGSKPCINVNLSDNQIVLTNPQDKENQKVFAYDNVFNESVLQQFIYEESAFQLVESVVEGFNGTIFAYGQTGCGKTHTMVGKPESEDLKGIIPRTFSHIVKIVNNSQDMKFLVRCSYIEIYNEQIMDLLSSDVKQKLDLKESPDKGVYIKDLAMNVVKTVEEMDKYMMQGTKNRSVGATQMNSESSRSHSIFTLYIEASSEDEKGNERFTAGKLNLVDLAGSERQSKTQAEGVRLKEATKINLSLSALGNVISALVDGKSSHIPYRDSKLTRLLQDSLGGNTKTIMIANISPADYNYDETLSTLRYASRAKNIKNKPVVNEDPKDTLLKEYANEIKLLKQMLQNQQNGGAIDLNQLQKMNLPISKESKIDNNAQQQNQNLNTQELDELKIKNNEINKQKQEMEQEVKQREMQLEVERQEKQRIEQLMKELNEKVMNKQEVDHKEKEEFDKIRQKMKKQQKIKKNLLKEKEKKEEEVLHLEKQYNSLQEEVEEMRNHFGTLRDKYKQSLNEIKDLEKEHEYQKEDLLDNIRDQQKDVQFYKGIAEMLLSKEEIRTIQANSEWNSEKQDYIMPPFYLSQKKVQFPKLPKQQGQQFVQDEKNERELKFDSKIPNNFNNTTSKKQSQNTSRQKNNNSYHQVSYPNDRETSRDQFRDDKLNYSNKNNNNSFNRYEDQENTANVKNKIKRLSQDNRFSNSEYKLYEKKQLPPKLTPMDDFKQLNNKLEKQNSINGTYENPLFSDKSKLIKQNHLKPLDKIKQQDNYNNILQSHKQNNQPQLASIRNNKFED